MGAAVSPEDWAHVFDTRKSGGAFLIDNDIFVGSAGVVKKREQKKNPTVTVIYLLSAAHCIRFFVFIYFV